MTGCSASGSVGGRILPRKRVTGGSDCASSVMPSRWRSISSRVARHQRSISSDCAPSATTAAVAWFTSSPKRSRSAPSSQESCTRGREARSGAPCASEAAATGCGGVGPAVGVPLRMAEKRSACSPALPRARVTRASASRAVRGMRRHRGGAAGGRRGDGSCSRSRSRGRPPARCRWGRSPAGRRERSAIDVDAVRVQAEPPGLRVVRIGGEDRGGDQRLRAAVARQRPPGFVGGALAGREEPGVAARAVVPMLSAPPTTSAVRPLTLSICRLVMVLSVMVLSSAQRDDQCDGAQRDAAGHQAGADPCGEHGRGAPPQAGATAALRARPPASSTAAAMATLEGPRPIRTVSRVPSASARPTTTLTA